VEVAAVREALLAFAGDAQVQKMVADLLTAPATGTERRVFLLDAIEASKLKQLPAAWTEQIGKPLEASDLRLRLRAVRLIRSRGIASLDDSLERVAACDAAGDELRTAALGALVARRPRLTGSVFAFLLRELDPKTDGAICVAAAEILGRADLSWDRLL